MKRVLKFCVITVFFTLSACGNGANSIPEMNAKLFEALKSGNSKKIESLIPSGKEMQKAYSLYRFDTTHDKELEQKLALERAASNRLSLLQDYDEIQYHAKTKGIDWKTVKLLNTVYVMKDRKEGYKDAQVQIIIGNETTRDTISYYTVNVMDKWYLLDQMNWK